LGPDEQRIVSGAGPEFFAAAVDALNQYGADLKLLTKVLKERTGKKGAELFMPLRVALTGQTHGPELAPLLHLMTPGTARRRLESHAQNP
jgi:glutamyl-tRNA synthetase